MTRGGPRGYAKNENGPTSAVGPVKTLLKWNGLHIRVPRGEHGRKACGLFLATTLGAGLLEVAPVAHVAQGAFAVQLLLQTAQDLVHGLALFQSDLSQRFSLPFQGPRD